MPCPSSKALSDAGPQSISEVCTISGTKKRGRVISVSERGGLIFWNGDTTRLLRARAQQKCQRRDLVYRDRNCERTLRVYVVLQIQTRSVGLHLIRVAPGYIGDARVQFFCGQRVAGLRLDGGFLSGLDARDLCGLKLREQRAVALNLDVGCFFGDGHARKREPAHPKRKHKTDQNHSEQRGAKGITVYGAT